MVYVSPALSRMRLLQVRLDAANGLQIGRVADGNVGLEGRVVHGTMTRSVPGRRAS